MPKCGGLSHNINLPSAFISLTKFPKPGRPRIGHQHCVLWLVFTTENQSNFHSGGWELHCTFLLKTEEQQILLWESSVTGKWWGITSTFKGQLTQITSLISNLPLRYRHVGSLGFMYLGFFQCLPPPQYSKMEVNGLVFVLLKALKNGIWKSQQLCPSTNNFLVILDNPDFTLNRFYWNYPLSSYSSNCWLAHMAGAHITPYG